MLLPHARGYPQPIVEVETPQPLVSITRIGFRMPRAIKFKGMADAPGIPDIILPTDQERQAAALSIRWVREVEYGGVVCLTMVDPPDMSNEWMTQDEMKEFPTEESAVLWAALRSRELVQEGKKTRASANIIGRGIPWGRFADRRNHPPREPQPLMW